MTTSYKAPHINQCIQQELCSFPHSLRVRLGTYMLRVQLSCPTWNRKRSKSLASCHNTKQSHFPFREPGDKHTWQVSNSCLPEPAHALTLNPRLSVAESLSAELWEAALLLLCPSHETFFFLRCREPAGWKGQGALQGLGYSPGPTPAARNPNRSFSLLTSPPPASVAA